MFIPKIATFALLMALISGGVQAETAVNNDAVTPIVLGPLNPLAIALNGILPPTLPAQIPLGPWLKINEAAIVPAGGSEAFVITCKTSLFWGRAAEPVEHFQGCTVTAISEIPDSVEVLTLGGLFALALPTDGLPTMPPRPICPRCVNDAEASDL